MGSSGRVSEVVNGVYESILYLTMRYLYCFVLFSLVWEWVVVDHFG
jgi:hypothetical protein